MSHNRAPKLGSKWYLPYDTYKYVVSYCYAYGDFRKRLQDLDGWHSHEQDGMPRGTETSDPTPKEAMRRMRIEEKINVIENAVIDTDPFLYDWLLEGVTKRGVTFNYLKLKKGMPVVDKNQYSELRRQVYYRVAERIM